MDTALRAARWFIGGAAGGYAVTVSTGDSPLGGKLLLLVVLFAIVVFLDLFMKYTAKSRE